MLGAARSGWRRGLVFFAIDLVGFIGAVVLAVRFHEIPALALDALGVPDRWSDIVGGLVIFVPLIVLTAMVGSRLSRFVFKPGLFMLNRVLGAAFGATTALAVIVVGILFARSALPEPVGDALIRSSIASAVLEGSTPLIADADERFGLDLCGGRLAEVVPEVCTTS